MPRYFFHVREDGVLFEDTQGTELATWEEAKEWAVHDARELLKQNVLQRPLSEDWMVIDNEDGETLAIIPFTELLIGY